MNRLSILAAGLAAAAAGGCTARSSQSEPSGLPPEPLSLSAELRDAAGRSVGTTRAEQVGDSIRVTVESTALPQGVHGGHIHAVGRCTAPDFASAGPHWNPTNQQHGKDNPAGMHRGDLPNLLVGTDGRGSLEYVVPGEQVSRLLDQDGAAIVVHSQADDYRTDPSGNSGGRIACGVLS